jgi:hypothetical protein
MMNVNRASLFPGLDGLGQYARHRLLIEGEHELPMKKDAERRRGRYHIPF